MKDECGFLGPMLTNPIITLPPNVLSTYVPPNYSIGSTYTDPNLNDGYFVGHAEPLTIADLQCPTFGLGIKTSADGNLYTTVGPPWLPVIIPPPEVFTLDPTWESICTDLASYYVFMSFAIFDPPFALAPESYLVAPSPAASSLKLKDPPYVSANPTAAYDPQATNTPDLSDPQSSPSESTAPPVGNFAAPQEPKADTAQPAAVPLDPSAKPTTIPDPPGKSPPKSQEGGSTHSISSGSESFVSGALGKSDHQSSGSGGSKDLTHIIPVPESGIEEVTVGGQILSVSPSGLYLSRTSYSPGGPAITVSDSVISLVSNFPAAEAAAPNADSPTDSQLSIPSVQTIAGHDSIALSLANSQEMYPAQFSLDGVTIQAEPSAAVVGGITLTPGGAGTVIHGKSISLEQGGTLNIGTGRFALPNIQTTPSAFRLDGMTVRLESSAVLIDGITLTPGGPGVSKDGNRVSLEQDRSLDIGSSHFALPPAAQETPSKGFNLNGLTVQAQQSTVAVNGIALTPGGPGTTINGSSVSLESGGILDIGTGRFAIPTRPVNGTSISHTFEGAQEEAHPMSRSLLFAALIVSGLWRLVS